MNTSDRIESALDDAKKKLEEFGDNVKDTVDEAAHRSTADAERARRDVDDGDMTAGEKAGSILNETKNRTQAEMDAAKRNLRNNT